MERLFDRHRRSRREAWTTIESQWRHLQAVGTRAQPVATKSGDESPHSKADHGRDAHATK